MIQNLIFRLWVFGTSHVARRLIFGMRPCFGPLLTILGKNLPGRAQGGQGGRMAITRELVGRQGPFKAETHSLTKIIRVFEAQRNDPTTPRTTLCLW